MTDSIEFVYMLAGLKFCKRYCVLRLSVDLASNLWTGLKDRLQINSC